MRIRKLIRKPRATALGASRKPGGELSQNDPLRLGGPVMGTLLLALAPNFLPTPAFVAVVVVALPLLLLGFSRPTFRLVWLCGGGVALLNTSDSISQEKTAYLIGVLLACVIAGYRLLANKRKSTPGTSLCVGGILVWFTWVLCVTLPQAVGVTNTPLGAWSRDAFTQLLMPAAVLICLDVSRDMYRDVIKAVIVTIGFVAMMQFAVTWTSRRGLLSGTFLLFGSQALLVLPLCMGLVYGLGRRGYDLRWLMLTCGAFASVLVTGTRQGLLLLFAFVGVGFPRKPVRISPLKLLSGLAIVGCLCFLALVVWAPYLGGWDFLVARTTTLTRLSAQGQITDMSLISRLQHADMALSMYSANPFFGVGLGVIQFGDTPLVQLAKLGLFGNVALLTSVGLILGGARSLCRDDSGAERVILSACVVTWLAMSATSSFMEDKGFSLGLGLLIALLGARARMSESNPTESNHQLAVGN